MTDYEIDRRLRKLEDDRHNHSFWGLVLLALAIWVGFFNSNFQTVANREWRHAVCLVAVCKEPELRIEAKP